MDSQKVDNVSQTRHFFAVLGKSNYKPIEYYLGEMENSYNSRFVQEAIIKLRLGQLNEGDRITVFLTDDARVNNWEDRVGEDGELIKGLAHILYEEYGEDRVKAVDIPVGASQKELDEMFLVMYSQITEGEEIYFDITHGLRHIPMMAITALQYAKVTKNIDVGGIYYGAFEMRDSTTNKTPIYDLTYYNEILDWTNAANSFVKYGNSNHMTDLITEKSKYINRNINMGVKLYKDDPRKIEGKLYSDMNKYAKALNGFTQCIATGRGAYSEDSTFKIEQSIHKAYEFYKGERAKVIDNDVTKYYGPLDALVEKIDDKVAVFDKSNTNLSIGIETTRWSIDNDMIQQAYTSLDETGKTFMCNIIGVPDDTSKWRDDFVKKLYSTYYIFYKDSKKSNTNKSFENNEELKLDEIWDMYLNYISEKQREFFRDYKEQGVKLICFLAENIEFCDLLSDVADKRNDINHFGFRGNPTPSKKLTSSIKENFVVFQEYCKKYL